MALLGLGVMAADQGTKALVRRYIVDPDQWVLLHGFFKFVHWGNTGAAWSMFHGNNGFLTLMGLIAFVALIASRHHFDVKTVGGQIALGLILGGIAGNIIDRVRLGHVTDFLYFYVLRRDGIEAGFPAFNLADMAICTGVGLLFVLSLRGEAQAEPLAPGEMEESKPGSDRAASPPVGADH